MCSFCCRETVFDRSAGINGLCQGGGELRLAPGQVFGCGGRFRDTFLRGSLEGGGGLDQPPIERGARGRVLAERRIVLRLNVHEALCHRRKVRRVLVIRFLSRRLCGSKLLLQGLGLLSVALFDRRLTLRGFGQFGLRALSRLAERCFRTGETVFERCPFVIRMRQGGAELRFAPREVLGRGERFGHALLRGLIERRCGTGQPLVECGARGSLLRQRRVVLLLNLAEALCRLCEIRRVPAVNVFQCGLCGG
jgi:hypothetical protein